MYDFEAEYRMIFETPLEEIKEDIFFRADNFEKETWYGDLQMYLAIGDCKPDRGKRHRAGQICDRFRLQEEH